MTTNHEHYMRIAIEEARIAERIGNPPVGAVLVRDGQVIARAHNTWRSNLDVTAHAETVALRSAGPAAGTVELPGATLYTTFQPCPMCLGAIMHAKVSTLVMGGRTAPGATTWGAYTAERLLEMAGWTSRLTVVTGVLEHEGAEILSAWRLRQRATPEDERYMAMAIQEASDGLKNGDQPFGAILVKDGKVLARGRNLENSTHDPTAHAETMALRSAGTTHKQLQFPGSTLYASWEPCPMCLGAIMAASVSRLVLGGRTVSQAGRYGQYNVEKLIALAEFGDRLAVVTGVLQGQSERIVNEWRRQRRAG